MGAPESAARLDDVVALALALPPLEKVQLIERIVAVLERDVRALQPAPRRTLRGALSQRGLAPSAEEIDEVRREAWANFPREDVL